MSGELFALLAVNGLAIGCIYALIASGFSLLFGICRVFNMAHGVMFMLGGMGVVIFYKNLHINFFAALIISVVCVALLGVLLERGLLRPRRGHMFTIVVITLAIAIITPPIVGTIFGFRLVTVPPVFPGQVELFGVFISKQKLLMIAASALIFGGLYLFVYRTKIGAALRAISQDDEAAILQGVDINQHFLVSMAVAAGLAAAAGVLLAPVYIVDPFIGTFALVKAIIVVVLGGMGSIAGAVVAGIALGLAESLASGFVGGGSSLVALGFVLLILMWRPSGLLGHE